MSDLSASKKQQLISPMVELAVFLSGQAGRSADRSGMEETGFTPLMLSVVGNLRDISQRGLLDGAVSERVILLLQQCNGEICMLTRELTEDPQPEAVELVIKDLKHMTAEMGALHLDAVSAMMEFTVTGDEKYLSLAAACLDRAADINEKAGSLSEAIKSAVMTDGESLGDEQ